MSSLEMIDAMFRKVPDFPKPGVSFLDFSPILADPVGFQVITELMLEPLKDMEISHIVAIDSRGFILGAPLAQALDAGFVMARKKGKLPGPVLGVEYDLEYGTDCLELLQTSLTARDRVVIVDDVLATGGTAKAAIELCQKVGAEVLGFSCLMEIDFLKGRQKFETPVYSLYRK